MGKPPSCHYQSANGYLFSVRMTSYYLGMKSLVFLTCPAVTQRMTVVKPEWSCQTYQQWRRPLVEKLRRALAIQFTLLHIIGAACMLRKIRSDLNSLACLQVFLTLSGKLLILVEMA